MPVKTAGHGEDFHVPVTSQPPQPEKQRHACTTVQLTVMAQGHVVPAQAGTTLLIARASDLLSQSTTTIMIIMVKKEPS
jgi:hypothetical protein